MKFGGWISRILQGGEIGLHGHGVVRDRLPLPQIAGQHDVGERTVAAWDTVNGVAAIAP
jgi:hypothetical protein